MTKQKKKRNKRNQMKYPALDPSVNLKTRSELIDYDYIDKLSDEEKDWLNRFTTEYINASFKHEGKKIMKTKEKKRKAYKANNARNRCIWTKAKASGQYAYIEDISKKASNCIMDEEDLMLLKIDLTNEVLNNLNKTKNRTNKGGGSTK
jgi:hypothetical protein